MPEKATYIHGTDPSEQYRLVELNRLTNRVFLEFLAIEPHTRAVDVGSGLGILAAEVADSRPGVRVVGVEWSSAQLAQARPCSGVDYLRADAHRLPVADQTFDLAYARYLLEHVSDPGVVLDEMRRVLRPGGQLSPLLQPVVCQPARDDHHDLGRCRNPWLVPEAVRSHPGAAVPGVSG